MRDNHQGYPEILRAYERDGFYVGVMRLEFANESASLEFGVEPKGCVALKRILQFRPFDNMPGVVYRYFFHWRLRDAEVRRGILFNSDSGRTSQ